MVNMQDIDRRVAPAFAPYLAAVVPGQSNGARFQSPAMESAMAPRVRLAGQNGQARD
jgi:hypothetical protein